MDREQRTTRVTQALARRPVQPPVTGLTFPPVEALASVVPGCGPGAASCLAATARALALDFVFVPASASWAKEAATTMPCAVLWAVDGPLWPVLSENGLLDGLRATVLDPPSLRAGLERETARCASEIAKGLSLGVAAVVIADDLAGSAGPFVPPAFVAEEVLPCLTALVAGAGSTPAVLHSDGDIAPLLTSVRDAGFAGVHAGGGLGRRGFEALCAQAAALGLSAIGGIDTASLAEGTAAAVRAGTRLALLSGSCGLLVADDGGLTTPEDVAGYAGVLGAVR
jgi:hypothetical protein